MDGACLFGSLTNQRKSMPGALASKPLYGTALIYPVQYSTLRAWWTSSVRYSIVMGSRQRPTETPTGVTRVPAPTRSDRQAGMTDDHLGRHEVYGTGRSHPGRFMGSYIYGGQPLSLDRIIARRRGPSDTYNSLLSESTVLPFNFREFKSLG